MNNLIGEHKLIVESGSKRKLIRILALVGILAIVFTVAFAVYRHFSKQDYIDDFDDDFDDYDDDYDDFSDDFFMDADEDDLDSVSDEPVSEK